VSGRATAFFYSPKTDPKKKMNPRLRSTEGLVSNFGPEIGPMVALSGPFAPDLYKAIPPSIQLRRMVAEPLFKDE
jgi:hypothetical protein